MAQCSFITVKIHYGGKFEGQNKYFGGEVDILEEWVWFGWRFHELVDSYVEVDCYGSAKFAFRVKNTDCFVFFDDEPGFCDNLHECVDWENKMLEVYVECDYLEVDVEDGIDGNDVGGDIGEGGQGDNDVGDDTDEDGHEDDDVQDQEFGDEINFDELSDAQDQEFGEGDVSTYEDSDASLYEDSDAEIKRKMEKHTQYDPDCDHRKLKLKLGMRFKDRSECMDAVKYWAIVNGHNIRWDKSNFNRLKAVCGKGCPWMMYASTLTHEPTFVIKTFIAGHGHGCVKPFRNRQCTSTWIAGRFLKYLKDDPTLKAKEIQRRLKRKYDTSVTLVMCYRAKKKALEILHGTQEAHYTKVKSYLAELQKRDREGTFLLKTYISSQERLTFQRVYIGFSALRKGFFIGCRKIIGFYACFLKTSVGGALLAAVSTDCNKKMYPIAWAVVEGENGETWRWFMERLFEDLGIMDGFGWSFMSDKQKGLINVVSTLAPNAEHKHCARHIEANWKKKYAGEKFHNLFWKCVKSTCYSQYNSNLDKLRAESADAANDFLEQNPKCFCKCFIMSYNKVDTVDNNICETFNSYILKWRDHLLIDMLEGIRTQLMTRMYELYQVAEKVDDVLCPNIRKELEDDLKNIKYCDLIPAADKSYEVHVFDDTYIVDLVERSCSCRHWELTGLPCFHVLACLFHRREKYVNFVDPFYYASNWKACYKFCLRPIMGEKDWPQVTGPSVLPPVFKPQPGRPKKVRKRGRDEPRSSSCKISKKGNVKMSCRNCGGADHNKRTCKATTTTIQTVPKRPRGRPRKNVSFDQPSASRPRGRPRKNAASGQSTAILRGSNSNQTTRERTLTSQGIGLLHTASGNAYIGGRRVQLAHGVVSSQNSHVDGTTPP